MRPCTHPRDEDPFKKKRQSRLKHHSRLPPVTPIACVRDTVGALVFDQLWEEVVGALQPLLTASKLRPGKGVMVCGVWLVW